MERTSDELVRGIVDADPSVDLEPFILSANELVNEVCAPVTTYSAARLELIERWLAARFYRIYDAASASEKAGPVSASYQYEVGLMLSQTREGQQAMLLDTAGGLAALSKSTETGKTKRGTIAWLGTASSRNCNR